MYCKKCGKEIPNNAKFCTGCGNKIEPLQPAPQPSSLPVQEETKPVSKKRKVVPIIIIAVVAALILIGGGVFAAIKIIDNLSFEKSSFLEEEIDFDDEKEDDEDKYNDRDERPATATTEAPLEEEVAVEESTAPVEEEIVEEESLVPEKESFLSEAAVLAESGDFSAAIAILENALAIYPDDSDLLAVYDLYRSMQDEMEPDTHGFLTTADIVSHESITPLIEEAYLLRTEANAKWDNETEIPGTYDYQGYLYLEDPENWDNNRIYLVFLQNATIKDTPIQFIHWVYFDDIIFDDQGIISYADMGAAQDDKYLVETGFGSYYSYYGLDDYDTFLDKIIMNNPLEIVDENVRDIVIEHPVSDTF